MRIVDQFEKRGTITEAMHRFADEYFGEPRKVDMKTTRNDGVSVLFSLVGGIRTYRITNVSGVWTITYEEPTT